MVILFRQLKEKKKHTEMREKARYSLLLQNGREVAERQVKFGMRGVLMP